MSAPTSSADSQYAALRNGTGFRVAKESVIARFSGDDRLTFLHGMCSNDVKNLKPGEVLEALVLTEHAHVIAGLRAFARQADLLLEVDRETWPRARAHLEKFLVADDVEIEDQQALAVIEILGPKAAAAAAIAAAGAADLAAWRFVAAADRMVARYSRYGCEAFAVIIPATQIDALLSELSRSTLDAIPIGEAALDLVRIENGIARIGVDTGEKTIALEARLESAISYDKGCYLGQETIERATARGGLKKRLFGLLVEASEPPARDSPVRFDGREVGRVSSAAVSPRFGAIALAILHHSVWQPSTAVTVQSGSSTLPARVSDLPFG
jgi:aminomethyltransferase